MALKERTENLWTFLLPNEHILFDWFLSFNEVYFVAIVNPPVCGDCNTRAIRDSGALAPCRQCLACYSHFGWWVAKGSSGVCGSTINKSTIPELPGQFQKKRCSKVKLEARKEVGRHEWDCPEFLMQYADQLVGGLDHPLFSDFSNCPQKIIQQNQGVKKKASEQKWPQGRSARR